MKQPREVEMITVATHPFPLLSFPLSFAVGTKLLRAARWQRNYSGNNKSDYLETTISDVGAYGDVCMATKHFGVCISEFASSYVRTKGVNFLEYENVNRILYIREHEKLYFVFPIRHKLS